ncbi:hypothetical protein [Aminivibrio sp.]|uniref:hypothetical protein n=1 Tax=Aminivibrio sp. TaxID=1872489 RepID=UPI003D98F0B6
MNYPFHDREEAPDLVISEMSGSGLNITEDGQSAVTLDDCERGGGRSAAEGFRRPGKALRYGDGRRRAGRR